MNVDRESTRTSRTASANVHAAAAEVPSVPAPINDAAAPAPTATSGKRKLIAVVGILVVALAATAYYLYSRQFEETDDAQVDGNISNVGSRVAGNIKAVYVVDNQPVKAGDVLAEVDTSDLEVALAAARAAVAQADAQLRVEDPNVPITETSNKAAVNSASHDISSAGAALAGAQKDVEQYTAQLAQAQANDRIAQLEKSRSEKLLAEGAVAQSDYDMRLNTAAATAANVDAIKQALAGAHDRVTEQQARLATTQSHLTEVASNAPRQVDARRASVVWRQASLDLAKAQLAQAELNLSYAKTTAPVTGIIGKKSVSLGDHVVPGQQLFAIADTQSLWVTANYRETQLERMHPGQVADLHVDAIDADLRGSVESIGGATGSRFSVLPPENASGNYVKVVQRIPVRIKLDPGQAGMDRLRPGMSVEPKVRVR
jgi:membrane fusion protein (multidrug efflux system)